eukprot:PhF_6_TR37203/c0_g2_i2/m.54830
MDQENTVPVTQGQDYDEVIEEEEEDQLKHVETPVDFMLWPNQSHPTTTFTLDPTGKGGHYKEHCRITVGIGVPDAVPDTSNSEFVAAAKKPMKVERDEDDVGVDDDDNDVQHEEDEEKVEEEKETQPPQQMSRRQSVVFHLQPTRHNTNFRDLYTLLYSRFNSLPVVVRALSVLEVGSAIELPFDVTRELFAFYAVSEVGLSFDEAFDFGDDLVHQDTPLVPFLPEPEIGSLYDLLIDAPFQPTNIELKAPLIPFVPSYIPAVDHPCLCLAPPNPRVSAKEQDTIEEDEGPIDGLG